MSRTMFEKIWSRHVVAKGPGGQSLLYVDRHLLHEGSTHAFGRLERKGRVVRRPEACVATADHYVPTAPGAGVIADPEVRGMVADLERHTGRLGITFFGRGEPRQGIVHVIGPEQGRDPARHLARVRGLAHRDPRGVRGARLRRRLHRGGARAGHPVPLAAKAARDADHGCRGAAASG